MSQRNVEMIRRAYEALARGDWDALFSDAHPDFEMTTRRGPNAGTHRGRDGVQGFTEDYMAAFENSTVEPDRFIERGDQVLALVTRRARAKGGGPEIVVHNDTARAMSQENVQVVRRAFQAFNWGGVEAVLRGGFWSPEIVWDGTPTGIPGLGVLRGQDQLMSFFATDWFAAFPFKEWEIEVDELIDHGDQVIAMSRQRGRGATGGAAAELELAQICTLRDGVIVQVVNYLDRGKALEALGLAE